MENAIIQMQKMKVTLVNAKIASFTEMVFIHFKMEAGMLVDMKMI